MTNRDLFEQIRELHLAGNDLEKSFRGRLDVVLEGLSRLGEELKAEQDSEPMADPCGRPDAYPGLAAAEEKKARQEIAALQLECKVLKTALEHVLVGGNHLANVISGDHPPDTASTREALDHYDAGDTCEVWCCWKAIREAGKTLRNLRR